MKLTEVKRLNEMSFISKLNAHGFLTNRIDIAQWVEKEAGIPGGSYTISKLDNIVTVHTSVMMELTEKGMIHCPVQFSEIEGDFGFSASSNSVISFLDINEGFAYSNFW